MCNGDLGMYRVMPWAYPPISGGSSGGFSPDDSGTGEGSGGGSHSDVTFYRDADTIASLYNVQYTSSIQFYVSIGSLAVGNLNGITKIARWLVVDELYFEDEPTKNAVGDLSTNEIQDGDFVPPFTDWTNSTDNIQKGINLSVEHTGVKVIGAVAHMEYRGYNSNGELIRTGSIKLDGWRLSS